MARSEGGRLLREQHARKIHFLCHRQRHKKLVEAVPAESVRRNAAERTCLQELTRSYQLYNKHRHKISQFVTNQEVYHDTFCIFLTKKAIIISGMNVKIIERRF